MATTTRTLTATARKLLDATPALDAALVATEAPREIDLIASTDTIDAMGEVIDQGSWHLDRFAKNPVALWIHDSFCEPVGFYRAVRVEAGALRATLVLYDDETSPAAGRIWRRYKQGGPVAFSVGFDCPRVAEETREGRAVRVLYDCDLTEISVVTIPANPDAVAVARTKAATLYRAHRRALTPRKKRSTMKLSDYMTEKGLTPEGLAEKAEMTADAVKAVLAGNGTGEQNEKVAAAMGLSLADLAEMLETIAEEMEHQVFAEIDAVGEPAKALPAPADAAAPAPAAAESGAKSVAAANAKALLAALGAKSVAEALVKVQALTAVHGEHAALTGRVKSLETELRALRGAEQRRERDAVLAAARQKGVLTPAREQGKVGAHLAKLSTPAEVKSYLETLEPAVHTDKPAEQPAPPEPTTASVDFEGMAKATGYSVEQLKKGHNAAFNRPLIR